MPEISILFRKLVFLTIMFATAVNFQSPSNAVDIKDVKKSLNQQRTQQSNIDISSMIQTCKQDSGCNNSRFIFLQLLKNPKDLNLNLLYAKDAERRGKLDRAIATYQRMAFLDPANRRWKDNIEKLRDLSKPAKTNIAAVLGFRVDSNGPLDADRDADRNGSSAEHNGSIVLTLDDKRKLGDFKYQTTGQFYADKNHNDPVSDLILGSLQFGPLLNMEKNWKMRPALSFERLATDRKKRNSFSYSRGALLNFANSNEGPLRSTDVSLYYLDFWDETPGKDAWVLTTSAELELEAFKPENKIRLSPRMVFNGARGGGGSDGFRDLYYEVSLGMEYSREIAGNFEIGPTFSYYYRDYIDYEPGGSTTRNDHNFNLGLQATAINMIPNIITLINYSFERNKSNLVEETYRNHTISISFVKTF
ncbi:uncharacterized protein METZ01_LOCUS200464 [marine metagenome]|uniref:DUF560 domain-containing protein n=1 Tax=marine metagenome TaxID=408172 RepID=A0A382EAF5_9ZZZZ